nr:hypothetical protein BJQ95_00377 [Cryobacterium sp. SO1]
MVSVVTLPVDPFAGLLRLGAEASVRGTFMGHIIRRQGFEPALNSWVAFWNALRLRVASRGT